MINEKVLIENIDKQLEKEFVYSLDNELTQKRAFANVLASKLALKYFNSIGENIDTSSGIHNIPYVLADLDISDIYWNNTYIDVRLCFSDDELYIPIKHFSIGIIPAAYMFIKIAPDLSDAEVLGFIDSNNIEQTKQQDGFYYADKNDLISFGELKDSIELSVDNYEIDDSEIYNYFDNIQENHDTLYLKLIYSYDGRLKFNKISKAQSIFSLVADNNSGNINSEIDSLYENNQNNFSTNIENSFEYTTVATPSLQFEDDTDVDITEELPTEQNQENYNDSITDNIENEVIVDQPIETLYNNEAGDEQPYIDEGFDIESIRRAKQRPKKILIASIAAIIFVAGGLLIYSKVNNSNSIDEQKLPNVGMEETNNNIENTEAMPIETVNMEQNIDNNEEGNAIAVPSIEKSLDASILVSNLKIDWEVPAGYASNTSATRYFVKLGKIIQLNLKAELLLLSKPPISNRIALEIQYNDATKMFEPVGIISSSGEKSVDDLIMQTVKKALKMKLSVNPDSFSKIQGNPVLIIKL